MSSSYYEAWREARRVLARALALSREAEEDGNARKVVLFSGLAQAELEQAVLARGQVLRHEYLEAHR